jgi:hypothetical protein
MKGLEVAKMSLNLIQNALRLGKEARLLAKTTNYGITEPLTPKAQRSHLYLLVRENLMKGCREASMMVLDHYKRSTVYGILVQATTTIFYYGYEPQILSHYNNILDELIGTH